MSSKIVSQVRKAPVMDKRRIAGDAFPQTTFDGFFRDCVEHWTWTCRNNPKKLARAKGALAKDWAKLPETISAEGARYETRLSQAFYTWVGKCITQACFEGDSQLLREMADALELWKAHRPRPHALAAALLAICTPRSKPFTISHIAKMLPRCGVRQEYDHAFLRRECRKLGLKVSGAPGRPAKAKG